ncbi:DUF2948 family protein [Vannielia litorea]|uniref:DUF2948 family protein n=1 Tax=Vannielia litorea TaxID=1217970 RepID=A0A1N6E4R8_9RHOB|nr:DUF2948 family protein [Vannielia litorea]SIN77999.1 Protein of unknown function [Vannielia litorea]
MAEDAKFEDGLERPIYIAAMDEGSLPIVSALVQDAVFPITEMKYDKAQREFALLLNRFRWEDKARAEARGRPYERVQSVLRVGDVMKVASMGIDRSDPDTILSLLSVTWEEGEDGTGALILTLAGDGAIRLSVECLDLVLKDVTRPYIAPSRHAPEHPEG